MFGPLKYDLQIKVISLPHYHAIIIRPVTTLFPYHVVNKCQSLTWLGMCLLYKKLGVLHYTLESLR